MSALSGHILTPAGFVRGELAIAADGRIERVHGTPVSEAAARADTALPLVLPGFIDTHVHGGGGADTMDAGDSVATLAQLHARHGTTALLATTMTAPLAEIEAALRALAPQCEGAARGKHGRGGKHGNGGQRASGAARVLGVHLEGPYISAERLGAQPPFTRPPSLAEIAALDAIAPIRLLTLAPEVPGNLALIPALVERGIRVQIGHSIASYEEAVQALERGAAGFTHLFNAMSGLHHRAPGTAGAALAHAQHAELIPDLLHVHAGAIRAALRAIPGLFCVSDSTAAAGMPDGDYRLGRQAVRKCEGGVRLADGTLAGSTLTLDQALRNLVSLGLTVAEASARTSTHAADYLGIGNERGRLVEGAWGDAVLLDAASLDVRGVFVEGEAIEVGG
ncbi:MAG: N-acetylglucosamine-6-phosphate deacetylase [Rubrivivax sp.]